MPAANGCRVCNALPVSELVKFNLLLADPQEWPKTVFADFKAPPGTLPAKMRNWGGIAYGLELLTEYGITGISRTSMQRHFQRHVPHLATTPAAMDEIGKMMLGPGASKSTIMPMIRPRQFADYYGTAIQLGLYALEKLRDNIIKVEEAGGSIDQKELMQLVKLGAEMSKSQAGLFARHAAGQETDDELRGFRDGSAPLPSERFRDKRIRVINGKSVPVTDRGRADRKKYNGRAAQEGSPQIGGQ